MGDASAQGSSIAQLLLAAVDLLVDCDSPRLDAEVLLAYTLGRDRSHLVAWPDTRPNSVQAERFRELVQQRAGGTPVAHLTGRREFWSLELEVTPDTLVPRPETELLVELALEKLAPGTRARVADLGTGSGAIALAVALERPACTVTGVESSQPALRVAEKNRDRLQAHNLALVHGDWCDALENDSQDLVLANPPYVAEHDPHLEQPELRCEPAGALRAGADGLDDLRRIIHQARRVLRPGARLLLEHGHDQRDAVVQLLEQAGYINIETHNDLAGVARVAGGTRPGPGA